jgi:hypothetical protein
MPYGASLKRLPLRRCRVLNGFVFLFKTLTFVFLLLLISGSSFNYNSCFSSSTHPRWLVFTSTEYTLKSKAGKDWSTGCTPSDDRWKPVVWWSLYSTEWLVAGHRNVYIHTPSFGEWPTGLWGLEIWWRKTSLRWAVLLSDGAGWSR